MVPVQGQQAAHDDVCLGEQGPCEVFLRVVGLLGDSQHDLLHLLPVLKRKPLHTVLHN